MKEYRRKYPLFSLCGLNCGLCPRYQMTGRSRCPGCGGKDFHLKHPSCAVITCTRKRDNAEFCFQCSSYPCKKYKRPSKYDSFISYRNVLQDMQKAATCGIAQYRSELDRKVRYLETLVNNYNDGRSKNFYCVAVNLLPLSCLDRIMDEIADIVKPARRIDKDTISKISDLFQSAARKKKIELKLRTQRMRKEYG